MGLWETLARYLRLADRLPDDSEAHQARSAAEARLEETARDAPAVAAAAEDLRQMRRRNHFGPMIAKALSGK